MATDRSKGNWREQGKNPRSDRSYNPFQEGYTPSEKKGYVPSTGAKLPKAPKGGTGQTSSTTGTVTSKTEK